jgi:hypothetical protein
MKKLAAIIAALFIPVAAAQTSTTPNLNNDSWTNTYNTTNLNCWQPGDSYCSPNGQPYVRPDSGQINFSYGMWDIYQYRNVNTALPSGGTGLVITGWHFQYTAKVGNNWDDASYDYLKSYVRIYGQGGQLIESANFVHGGTHDWYTFNLANSYNPLTSRYTTDNFTQVRYGFVGQDYNGWVGPYGPEIYNVSFTLNYQPDPCLRSQLVSPQCPGFMEAISKISAVPKQPEVTVESTATNTVIVSTTSTETKKTGTAAQVVAKAKQRDEVKLGQYGPEQTADSAATEAKTTNQAAATTVEQTRITQQTRTQTRATSQVQAEVSAADSQQLDQLLTAGSKQAQEQTTVAASTSTVNTNTAATSSVDTTSSVVLPSPPISQQAEPEPVNTQVAIIRLPEFPPQAQMQLEIPQPAQMEQPKPQTDMALVQPSVLYTPPQQLQAQQTVGIENIQVIEQPVLAKIEPQAQEVAAALPSNMLTDKTNPINDIVTAQPQIASMPTFSGPTVNQRTQDNDAAGGVGIAQLARIPLGFEAYNIALKDVAFYAPREIYRNQRNVDNIRALRQLGSDRLHQEMVNQQYRR